MKRLAALVFVSLIAGDAIADEVKVEAREARIAPSFDGHFGAWLVLGPFESASRNVKTAPIPDALATDPQKLVESTLAPTLPTWMLAATNAGAIDLKNVLKSNPLTQKTDLIAYAAGTLHLARAEKIIMLLGSDDGVRVSIDGKVVHSRDEARPQRDDDDSVMLDLAAGDHPILFKLHQRDGAWSFRVRFVDSHLAPPEGAWLALPGVDDDRKKQLATQMSRGYADLGTRGDAYVPHVHARFTEGAPIGVPLRVTASLEAGGAPLFDIDAGEATLQGPDLDVQLPAITGTDLAAIEDKDVRIHATIAGRAITATFHPRKAIREAIKRTDEITARIAQGTRPPWLREDTIESLQNARNRLAGAQNRGDTDTEALTAETRELAAASDALEHDRDPYQARTGPMRWRIVRRSTDSSRSTGSMFRRAGSRAASAAGRSSSRSTA